MISLTLEEDLKEYALSNSNQLFEEKLYAPLVNVINWVFSKQYNNCNVTDKKDLTQLILIRITKNMKYYNPSKGVSAQGFVQMLISQEIHKNRRKIEQRNEDVEYVTEYDKRIISTEAYNVSIKEIISILEEYMKHHSLNANNRKVVISLILILRNEHIKWIGSLLADRIKMIKKHSGTTTNVIKETLVMIKEAGLFKYD
jgi:DNA-directed RNA polymerase specialized sigma subunit